MKTKRQSRLKLQVGGTVNPREGVYVVRPSDAELLRLLERGEYANVLCSRQMGKSSLLLRTKLLLEEKGYGTAQVDVAGCLGSPSDAGEWYRGLLDEIARRLHIDIDVTAWWESSRAVTPNQRLLKFFRDEIAATAARPVVIFLDEIDSTYKLPYTDDFFVAIRAMYNDRAAEELYGRVTFCLAGVATPNELIKDPGTTPYNIGRTIELDDFDHARDDISPLIHAVAADPEAGEAMVSAVLRWTEGHPYLTLRLCERLIEAGLTRRQEIDRAIEGEFVSLDRLHADVHFRQVLRFLDERVEDKAEALALYRQVRAGQRLRDQTTGAHIALRLAGIVKRDRHGYLMVRNPIYARVFTDEWAAKELEAEASPFTKLLELLAPDPEQAGEEFMRLHGALIKYFTARRCDSPEDLADETFNRVANRLAAGAQVSNLTKFCLGVARNLFHEHLRHVRRRATPLEAPSLIHLPEVSEASQETERRHACLERCMQTLPPERREFILEYYRHTGPTRIKNLNEQAARQGISVNALRLQANRIRANLQDCVRRCLEERERG